jgi:hypothetical protein
MLEVAEIRQQQQQIKLKPRELLGVAEMNSRKQRQAQPGFAARRTAELHNHCPHFF